jgi:hypothetical protein
MRRMLNTDETPMSPILGVAVLDFEVGQRIEGWEDLGCRREVSELGDGLFARVVEKIVDVLSEVGADGRGRDGDARGPLVDEGFDVFEAVLTRGVEIEEELLALFAAEPYLRADGPDRRDPGKAGVAVPEVGKVMPGAGGCLLLNRFAIFEGEEGGVADEERGVVLLQHGDGIGRRRFEAGVGVEEVAEEEFGVGDGAPGGGVGGDGADVFEVAPGDELDGADAVERGDGAPGHDTQGWGERGDGDEAEVGGAGEKLACASRGLREVDVVAEGEGRAEGRVVEVPHEGRGIEEVDGSYAERHKNSVRRC